MDVRFGGKNENPKKVSNEVIRNNKHKQIKEQVLVMTSKRKKLANMLYQAHKNVQNKSLFENL